MAGVRSDEVGELDSFLLEGEGHHVGGLLLDVLLAAVGHGRAIEQIAGIVGGVVQVPELLLVQGRFDHFLLEDLQEFLRFAEAGAWGSRAPQTGIMRGQLPAGRPAHREAADDATGLVNGIACFDAGQRLQAVDLAGELVGAAVAAIQVQNDGVGGDELAGRFFPAIHKGQFRQLFASAMAPDVEPMLAGQAGLERRRHHQAVRLHRAIDLRDVAAHDQPGLRRPGRLALAQRAGPVGALLEQVASHRYLLEVVELIVGQGVANRVVVDLDVRKEIDQASLALEGGAQSVAAQTVDFLAQSLDALLQLIAVGLGNLDTDGRHRVDLVGGAVGSEQRNQGEPEQEGQKASGHGDTSQDQSRRCVFRTRCRARCQRKRWRPRGLPSKASVSAAVDDCGGKPLVATGGPPVGNSPPGSRLWLRAARPGRSFSAPQRSLIHATTSSTTSGATWPTCSSSPGVALPLPTMNRWFSSG